jgi:hypothetical protein
VLPAAPLLPLQDQGLPRGAHVSAVPGTAGRAGGQGVGGRHDTGGDGGIRGTVSSPFQHGPPTVSATGPGCGLMVLLC